MAGPGCHGIPLQSSYLALVQLLDTVAVFGAIVI